MIDIDKLKDKWDWYNYARPEQLEPISNNWAVWYIKTGRGWGKTRTGAETVCKRVETNRAHNIALVTGTAADARDVMVDELQRNSGILSVAPPWFRPIYSKSNRRLVWPNGAVATLFAAEDPDALRGPQHDFAWCDELAAWPKNNIELTWSNLMFGLRQGSSQCIVTTTPKPVPIFKRLLSLPTTILTEGSTYDNIQNLSTRYIDTNIKPYEGTRQGKQELYGEILDDTPGALWTEALLEQARIANPELITEDLTRIVIGVDPAGSHTGHEIGIIVGGRGKYTKDGYCLADYSLNGTPDQWAEQIIHAYDHYHADAVAVETNYGGEMVEAVIRLKAKDLKHSSINIIEVHATRGKVIRAEPISGLSQQMRIHHVGNFPKLEDQMCEFISGDANDRVDAYVWTFTELMLGVTLIPQSDLQPKFEEKLLAAAIIGTSRLTKSPQLDRIPRGESVMGPLWRRKF